MSLAPSLRNRVRKLEAERDAGAVDRAAALGQARARWERMTAAEREACDRESLARARAFVAEHGEGDWNDRSPHGLACRIHEAVIRVHNLRSPA